ncbi:MAG: GNAT family N-acetyltransferase [Chitinophagaceae bacterium]
MSLIWKCKTFDELSAQELYAILQLRSEVFVVEQNCVYLDMDDKDQDSYHFCGWNGDDLFVYTRLVPAGISYDEPSIGRVVTSPKSRGTGAGKELMKRSIEQLHTLWGKLPIRIGAQAYLQNFYESLGFVQTSDIYIEDGIAHMEMLFPIREAD